jgi:small subunit ribosomal protein S9
MEILARAVGRRKEAVAQVQIIRGTGQFLINDKLAQEYLHNNSCSLISVKAPFEVLNTQLNECGLSSSPSGSLATPVASSPPPGGGEKQGMGKENDNKLSNINFDTIDTLVKVKGGGLIGQAEAIKLGVARAICDIESSAGQTFLSSENIDQGVKTSSLDNELRKQLKTKGYLTQDSRVKERRKYGLKKARKASQYHKR